MKVVGCCRWVVVLVETAVALLVAAAVVAAAVVAAAVVAAFAVSVACYFSLERTAASIALK